MTHPMSHFILYSKGWYQLEIDEEVKIIHTLKNE